MHGRYFSKLLVNSPLLALPLLVVPALCFALNRASFLWSLMVIGLTSWRCYRVKRDTIEGESPANSALFRLVLATLIIQILAFAWIGAVWMLEGIGRLIMISPGASRVVAWVQTQWFAELATWLVLFVVVCGLFLLGKPLLEWHRRAVHGAIAALSERESRPPTALSRPS